MNKTLGLLLVGVLAVVVSVCNNGVVADSSSSGNDVGILFGWPPGIFYAADSPTDLAVDGLGYFILRDSSDYEEEYFSRFGAFTFNNEGGFVSPQGYIVRGWKLERNPQTGEAENIGSITDIKIYVPLISSASESTTEYAFYKSSISVDKSGMISAMDTDGHTMPLFRIALAKFQDTHRLSNSGDNLFQKTEASGEAITSSPGSYGFGSLEAYALEELSSNPSYETSIFIDGDGLFFLRSPNSNDQFYYSSTDAFRLNKEGNLVTSNDYVVQGWALEQNEETGEFEKTGGIADIRLESFTSPPQKTDRITIITDLDSEGENNSIGINALSLSWNGDHSMGSHISHTDYVFSASEKAFDASGGYNYITIYFDMSETGAEYEFIITCNPTEDDRFNENPTTDAGHGLLGRGLLIFAPDGVLSDMTFARLVLSDPLAAGAWEPQALPFDESVPYFKFAADFTGGTETQQLIALDLGAGYDGNDWIVDSLSTSLAPVTAFRYSASNGHVGQDLSRSLINDAGIVTGYYSEGLVLPLFQIALASFQDETALEKVSDNLYRETTGSGAPTTSAPGTDGFGTLSFEVQEPADDTSDDSDPVISCFLTSVLR